MSVTADNFAAEIVALQRLQPSIFERQRVRREYAEWYGPWPAMLAAIREARGARESADVGDEEAERAFQAKRAAEEAAIWAAARNMTPEEYAEYSFFASRDALLGITPPLSLLFAESAEPAERER